MAELTIPEIKQKIKSLLGFTTDEGWVIYDTDLKNHLVLIRYDDAKPTPTFIGFNGDVIDYDKEIYVCHSLPYASKVVTDKLPLDQDVVELTDEFGVVHSLDQTKGHLTVTPGFEGVVIRIFKYNNVIYYSTNRKLDSTKSKWGGDSETFKKMYHELGGIDPDFLFDKETISSPISYCFMIVHPSLQMSSSHNIGNGFILGLTSSCSWSLDEANCPFYYDGFDEKYKNRPYGGKLPVEVEMKLPEPPSLHAGDMKVVNPKQPFAVGAFGSLSVVNPFLSVGMDHKQFNLPKEYKGEFVIINYFKSEGMLEKCFRVVSPGYEKRLEMRGKVPNVATVLIERLQQAHLSSQEPEDRAIELFKEKYFDLPIITNLSTIKEMAKEHFITNFHVEGSMPVTYKHFFHRCHLIFQNMLLVSSPCHQSLLIRVFDNFLESYDILTTALYSTPHITPFVQKLYRNNVTRALKAEEEKIRKDMAKRGIIGQPRVREERKKTICRFIIMGIHTREVMNAADAIRLINPDKYNPIVHLPGWNRDATRLMAESKKKIEQGLPPQKEVRRRDNRTNRHTNQWNTNK